MREVRNLWAIPDIHGRLDLLESVLQKLQEKGLDLGQDKIVFLGDMVDRGPDSRGVLEKVRELQAANPESVVVLAGNHEWLLIDACSMPGNQDKFYLWLMNGGGRTLGSFPGDMVPPEVVKWLAALPLSHEEEGFFFSHAPVPPEEERNSALKGKSFSKHELIWTYHEPEDKYARTFEDGRVGVCGHVHALRRGVKEPRLYSHYIFADAGAGCSDSAPLVAIEVKTREVVYS